MADEPVNPQGPPDDKGLDLDEEARERRRVALAQVRRFGDPVLNSPASPVTTFDEELASDAERMTAVMRDAVGVGLAATQLGVMRRLLIMQPGLDAPAIAVANPELEWVSREVATAEEGCLSIPGVIVDVDRSLYVRMRGVGIHGEPLMIEASGLEARVLQHEIDHLDGILMLERTTREQRKGALAALREGEAYAPPQPDEKDEAEEPAPAEA